MFEETKEGQTNYCQACENDAKNILVKALHTCGNQKTNKEWEKKLADLVDDFISSTQQELYRNEFIKDIYSLFSSERQRLREKIEKTQIGWYNEGEGLDIEFSAQEMKDDILKLLEDK